MGVGSHNMLKGVLRFNDASRQVVSEKSRRSKPRAACGQLVAR
jgi:hypothetical protein